MFKSTEEISHRKFIGKFAEIQTTDNQTHSGHIYVVDPESKSVVLTNKENRNVLKILTATSIKSITVNSNIDIGEISIINQDKEDLSPEDLLRKKRRLKEWLQLNLIDIVEDGDALKFQEHLIIEPPYDIQHCYCANTIVLDRFRNIIEKIPANE